MACGCKNKQKQAAKTSVVPPRKTRPINNGGVASRRIEKRIIR